MCLYGLRLVLEVYYSLFFVFCTCLPLFFSSIDLFFSSSSNLPDKTRAIIFACFAKFGENQTHLTSQQAGNRHRDGLAAGQSV